MNLLEGKRAIILGAGERGSIGYAIASRYAKEGARVLVASRREDMCARTARELGGIGMSCDITDRSSVFNLFDSATKAMGGVDIAINSTGLALGGSFLEFSEADMDRLIALQFKGSFFFLQAAVRAMQNSGGGAIIQLSSAVAQPGTTVDGGYDAYMGTKAGIDQVVRAVANQYGKYNIRVNTISAGHTDTPMHDENFGGQQIPDWMKNAFIEQYPLGRYGTPEDIAEAAVWLGRDECFMTGQALQVNGGLTLRRNPLEGDFERNKREQERGHA
ncbi:MAG: SDR family oxidoreductase [Sphingomonadaceae bacterium]